MAKLVPMDGAKAGVMGDSQAWMTFNYIEAFETEGGLNWIAPFPPIPLMQNTSGLTENRHFAEHGVAIFEALEAASPLPLNSYKNILDFGVGVGRLARMFHGFGGTYTGVDIDERHINWVSSALKHVEPVLSKPHKPLPLPDGYFDMIVGISIFTHMNELDTAFYIKELNRVAAPGAQLFLTVHGERAHARAIGESNIFQMLSIPPKSLRLVEKAFKSSGFCFIRQDGHLTSSEYDYGITFINEKFVGRTWASLFESWSIVGGAIHDFQDIVVLNKRDVA